MKTISVTELADKLNIDPKTARAKLRRHEDELPPRVGDGWEFKSTDARKVERVLAA